MNQVLILTKNILNEEDIQKKLQTLNFEVYCTTAWHRLHSDQVRLAELINFFPYVIISENICKSEIDELMPLLKDNLIGVMRKVEGDITQSDEKNMEDFITLISINASISEIREHLYDLYNKIMEAAARSSLGDQNSEGSVFTYPSVAMTTDMKEQVSDVITHLTVTETKVISVLIEAGDRVVSREELCRKIWHEPGNNSHLASLSNYISNIKTKFKRTDLENTAIATVWGEGYRINPAVVENVNGQ